MSEPKEYDNVDILLGIVKLVAFIFIVYGVVTCVPPAINSMVQEAKELRDNVQVIKNQNHQILELLSKKSS